MKKILVIIFILIAGACFGQSGNEVPEFYGYVGREISSAVPNEGKELNEFIRLNEGKDVKLTVFMDKEQAENFERAKQFDVHSDLVEKYPVLEYVINSGDGEYYVYDPEVNSLEGKFNIKRIILLRSLVVRVMLESIN